MSDYKPGTVAMVECTKPDCAAQRHQALNIRGCWWYTHNGEGHAVCQDAKTARVTPLVCIEATPLTASVLERVARTGFAPASERGTIGEIAKVIRAQAPNPPAEPLTADAVRAIVTEHVAVLKLEMLALMDVKP